MKIIFHKKNLFFFYFITISNIYLYIYIYLIYIYINKMADRNVYNNKIYEIVIIITEISINTFLGLNVVKTSLKHSNICL